MDGGTRGVLRSVGMDLAGYSLSGSFSLHTGLKPVAERMNHTVPLPSIYCGSTLVILGLPSDNNGKATKRLKSRSADLGSGPNLQGVQP